MISYVTEYHMIYCDILPCKLRFNILSYTRLLQGPEARPGADGLAHLCEEGIDACGLG